MHRVVSVVFGPITKTDVDSQHNGMIIPKIVIKLNYIHDYLAAEQERSGRMAYRKAPL